MHSLLKTLEARGELRRVTKPVDPQHQLAAVTRAVQRAGGEAVTTGGAVSQPTTGVTKKPVPVS